MQGPAAVLNIVTYPFGALPGQKRIVIDGVRGAIFEYAAGAGLGNTLADNPLVSSWASSAGTDPYGNTYPQGFNAGSGSSFTGTDFYINSSGAFFYSGTPGAGNPPVLAITPPGVTTDQYGNPVLNVLQVGNASGAHMEVDQHGVIYLTNASNSITILLDPTLELIEIIPGGLGTQPSVTIAAAAGTDPGFFTFPAGISTNQPAYITSLFIAEGTAPTVPSGYVGLYADIFGDLHILQAPLFLDSGYLQLPNESAPASSPGSVRVYANSGHLETISTDLNGYDTERLTLVIPAATLNSTTNKSLLANVPTVAATTYSFHGWVQYANSVAADPPIFELTGPATSACNYQFRNNSISAGTVTATAAIKNALSSTFAGGNTITTGQFVEVWGTVTFSATGSFNFLAACTLAADTVAITRGEFILEPVTSTA
jgi:hypothetical protein